MQQSRSLFGCQVFDPGDLPQDWSCAPLGERIELAYGCALRADQRASGSVQVFGSNGQIGTHSIALSNGPGILVGRKGSVGAVQYAEGPFWAIDTTYYVVLKEADCLKFVYYLLQYLPLKNLNAATGVPGLSRRDAYALRGAFPPKWEQEKIANLLSKIDKNILHIAGVEGLRLAQVPLFGGTVSPEDEPKSEPTILGALIALRGCLMRDLLTGRVRVSATAEEVTA